MVWGQLAALGGSALAGLIGGDDGGYGGWKNSALLSAMGYTPGAHHQSYGNFPASLARDSDRMSAVFQNRVLPAFKQNLRDATQMGKSGKRRIEDWESRERAGADVGLSDRGLGNTTVRNSVMRGIGGQSVNMKQDLRESVMQNIGQHRLALADAHMQRANMQQGFRDRSYDMQLGFLNNMSGFGARDQAAQFAQGRNQSQGQLFGGIGNMLGGMDWGSIFGGGSFGGAASGSVPGQGLTGSGSYAMGPEYGAGVGGTISW